MPGAVLNLSVVPPRFQDLARRTFDERDALGFVMSTGENRLALQLVFDNVFALRRAGMYEAALLQALTGTRTNHAHWTPASLRFLLSFADPARLRAAGDPLPGPGPFHLYRGVAGDGSYRRVRGLHWTATPTAAAWFARRLPWLADPAVYVADVPPEAVLGYVSDGGEDDYLVILPPRIRPERLPEMPEPVPARV